MSFLKRLGRARLLWGVVLVCGGPLAAWAETPTDAVPADAVEAAATNGATASDAAEPEAPPRYLTADVSVTELQADGTEHVTRYRFQRYGTKARIMTEYREGDRFEGDTLYDFERREYYRKLADEGLTFSYRLMTRERIKVQVHGLMNIPEDESLFRVVINKNLEFDGHPCTLVLRGLPAGGRIRALHWIWEAQDLDNQVVRVVFPDSYDDMTIVEFRNADNAPFDPALVTLPEGTMVMSSF